MANPGATRQAVKPAAAAAGLALSTSGLDKRCKAKAACFLDRLLAAAVHAVIEAAAASRNRLTRFTGM